MNKRRKLAVVATAALIACGANAADVFGPGVHYLEKPLVLTAADSGRVFRAEKGKPVRISGGRLVTGWRKEADGLWSAAVPWVTDREHGFRHLTVNGVRHERAKAPNDGYFTSLPVRLPGFEKADWHKWTYDILKPRFAIKAGDVDPKWDLRNGEVVFYHIWVDSHVIPEKLTVDNAGTNWVELSLPVRRDPCNSPWRLENLREIADRPGEWALVYGEKRLYYRPLPGEDMATAEVVAPYLTTLLRVEGAEDVRFEGIVFEDSRWELAAGDRNDTQASFAVGAAVVLTNAVRCTFEGCTFENLDGYAIDMHAGTRDCHVLACDLRTLGAGGVHLTGNGGAFVTDSHMLPDPRTRVRDNEIADCEIRDYGLVFPSAVGVLIRHAEGTKVHHNAIHDGYYSGVSVGWVWGYLYSVSRDNEIRDNHIWNIGKGLLSDMGGVYTLGVSPGTKVCHNLIHDVDARNYGGWGLYNDEGSTGILVEDNIVYNTKFAAYHMHFGRDCTVRNNILAGGRIDQLTHSRLEPHVSFSFYNNIVYWTEGILHAGHWDDSKEYEFTYFPGRKTRLHLTTLCDYNVYYNPKIAEKDARFGTGKAEGSFADWQKGGQDVHSVWADPLFADAAAHDYTLKPGSPALKMGFRPIDVKGIGPRRP